MKYITILCLLISSHCLPVFAQQELTLGLDDALRLAQSKSLQSFLVKNYYLSDYWQYRSFRADYLPSVSLTSKLFNYNNSTQLRYNSNTRTDEFQRTENLSFNAYLNVNQKIALTGGTLFVNTNLGRIQNYGEQGSLQYSSTPIQIGYRQKLFGFNAMKWERKTEPIKFEKAKKEYVESVEAINVRTVKFFFQLALAELNLKINNYNFHQTDTLLQIAEKRFKLGSVSPEELLDLRLNKNNMAIGLQESKLNRRRAKEGLLTFLMLPTETSIVIQVPKGIPDLQINAEQALQSVLTNNPEIVQQELLILEADMKVSRTKMENRFNADLRIDMGISKNDGRLTNVYHPDFDDRQIINVGLTMPILDWGKRKGQYEVAKSQRKITEIASQQAIQQLKQNTITKVLEFNLLKDKVSSAEFSDVLASESYELTVVRFRKGNTDVFKLVSSQRAKANAEVKYISALFDYWESYYNMRQLTLFDFQHNKPIEFDLEKL